MVTRWKYRLVDTRVTFHANMRIAFTLDALNDVNVLSTDVHNTHLPECPMKERIYSNIAGP
jgi:hypothetical protein